MSYSIATFTPIQAPSEGTLPTNRITLGLCDVQDFDESERQFMLVETNEATGACDFIDRFPTLTEALETYTAAAWEADFLLALRLQLTNGQGNVVARGAYLHVPGERYPRLQWRLSDGTHRDYKRIDIGNGEYMARCVNRPLQLVASR